jgi:transcriptional regulator of acetoin/glycerol metabolism
MLSIGNDVQEAGRIYKARGAIPAGMLRTAIYHAWERSHLQGANPRALQAEKLSSLETQRLLADFNYLIQAIRPYSRYLSQAAGSEPHAVILSDRRAILLDIIGDAQTVQNPNFPQAGSLLSEAVAGANGIGTPLAEENYVEIIANEHFIEGFHPFTCQGIPIRNDKQEIVGALSVSLQRQEAGKRLKEILLCASRAIESEFLVNKLETDIHRVLTASPEDYQPLEQLRQDIIQAHQSARLKLEVISRMVAVNRFDYAMNLLQQAEKSIQIFRDRSKIWHNLASLEVDTVQPVSLTDSIRNLVDLLSTELAIRKVELVTNWLEPVTIKAEPRTLLRLLLRYFLQAFENAGQGGKVEVIVSNIPNDDLIKVSFLSIPGLKNCQSKPVTHSFNLPLIKFRS